MLVETIAAAHWRQRRILGMQKVAFDHDVASCTSATELNPLRAVLALHASPESIRTHELLLRYEVALDRQISRALLRLHQLQARELEQSRAKGAVQTANAVEEPIAPPSVLRGSEKTTSAERTQQPAETVTSQPSMRPLRPSAPPARAGFPQASPIPLAPKPPTIAKTHQVTRGQSRKKG